MFNKFQLYNVFRVMFELELGVELYQLLRIFLPTYETFRLWSLKFGFVSICRQERKNTKNNSSFDNVLVCSTSFYCLFILDTLSENLHPVNKLV